MILDFGKNGEEKVGIEFLAYCSHRPTVSLKFLNLMFVNFYLPSTFLRQINKENKTAFPDFIISIVFQNHVHQQEDILWHKKP